MSDVPMTGSQNVEKDEENVEFISNLLIALCKGLVTK
jgi:hypothetical protein